MELTFLSGPVALTKAITFSARTQTFTVSAYPLVQKVTSHTEQVTSLADFAAALIKHGAQGRALLKGNLDGLLENESRAGHWVDAPHEWVVFDFDKVACAPTIDGVREAIKRYLPACCHDVDCLVQLSSSCYRPDAAKLSAHIFMRLDSPVPTARLNQWITWINFNSPLKDELSLTDSGMALHFPLDRSVNVPSKLIYVAPPRCHGFTPAVDTPFTLLDGARRTLALPAFTPVGPEVVSETIGALRASAGLPERPYRTRMLKGVEVMVDAEECVIHDIKPSGEGYIRFNMNGGDSLAYYINLKEPNLIGNHKGEPFLVTEAVAPDLYKALVKKAKALPANAMQTCAMEPLAFYATNRGSQLYVGTYDRENDILRLDPSVKDAAFSWLMSFGAPIKPNFPHYDLVFDMQSDLRFEDGYPVINLFRRTSLMKQYGSLTPSIPVDLELVRQLKKAAPVTYRVLDSVLGNNQTAVMFFLNWLAAIFQRRTRTNTGWVLSGTEGTGKGFVTNYIMRHLFGDECVTQQQYEHVNDKFNEFLEGRLVVSLNEAAMSKTIDRDKVMSKLREWITEPQIVIRGMHKAGREATNHANFIVCSNDRRPIVVPEGDRRWNFGEYQTERMKVNANELAIVTEGREMDAFAQLLGLIMIDDERLNTPYEGETKQRVYEATHSLLDRTARAINEGDVEFFLEVRPSTVQLQTDYLGRSLPTADYDRLLRAMLDGSLKALRHEDLYVLFRMVTITEKQFPETKAAQRQIFQRYGLLGASSKTVFDPRFGRSVRGIPAPKWNVTDTAKEMAAEIFQSSEADAPRVRPIRKTP